MKHKVRMLSSQKGVHDGDLHPVDFVEGTEHEVGPDLLQGFINLGAVELVDEAKDDAADEDVGVQKSQGAAPANKMKKAAPENKSKNSD